MSEISPVSMLRPRRKILGMSAILLPYLADHSVDWASFDRHVERTLEAGLVPAVNMDTGYINLLDDLTKLEVLRRTQLVCAGQPFVAGAFIADQPGALFDRTGYLRRVSEICQHGGTPVIFQSFGLTSQSDDALVESYVEIGRHCDRFIGFELGQMFAPFGKIYSLDAYRGLMGVSQCIGAKHSSLSRELEWQRLLLRDQVRPDFHVFTGNDLAIDMVMYGSDYLLGLSTFAPDLFARRDAYWAEGDARFYELNDVLQYLGFLAFRNPVPAYKHSASMFLNLREWIATDLTHSAAQTRPAGDREILSEILSQLERL
mgnify:CR=1 FL=1